MAQAGNQDLTERFIRFYRNYYREEIGTLAQRYPSEQRSLYVEYDDLFQFDRDLAEDFRTKPDQMREYAEEALRLYDLPADVNLGRAHVRLRNLPENVAIRGIRVHDDHIGKLVSVRGIVRKATDVRPKVTEAAFECQRCGTMTYIPQSDGGFQEPHECQGCERQGPFRVNFDQSEFVDSQKLRIQESPEGLRGGETPQSLDIDIEDDITGEVSPGDHVTAVGVLHIEQVEQGNEKSAIFDLYMDGVSIAVEDEEFEDMEITDADKREIVELSERDDIYEAMVASIAPAIYGYEEEKLAMILQLFSGVTKHLPDGSRIRGDLHMLLIGDPGTGKCVKSDTRVTLGDGRDVPIRELVEENLDEPKSVDDGVWDGVDFEVPSLRDDGTIGTANATKVWKREAPETMYRIETASGRSVEVTPSHPLFVQRDGRIEPIVAEELDAGRFIATPKRLDTGADDTLHVEYRRSRTYNAIRLDPPDAWTPELARLLGYIVAEGYVEQRDDHSGFVSITNNDEAVLSDARSTLESLGLETTTRGPHRGKDASELMCSASEFVRFLERLDPSLLEGSARQRVPPDLFGTSDRITREFVKAFVEGKGHVSATQREITVASTSEALLEDVRSLLLQHGITTQLHDRHDESYRLRISGEQFDRYVSEIGFETKRKREAAERHLDTGRNTNVDVIPNVGTVLRRIREALELTQDECGVPRGSYRHYEAGTRDPSTEALSEVVGAFESELPTTGGSPSGSRGWTDGGSVADRIASLRRVAGADVQWDRIESIEAVASDDDWVYDLEVEGTHSYVSNGIVSHNSQMISYIRHIAPRSVYTSGKGSSSAGLCVTGDTKIHTTDGFVPIREIATEYHPNPVEENTAIRAAHELYTFDREAGAIDSVDSSHVWRMPEKPCRRIETAHGKGLEASVNTPVLACTRDGIEWREISDVSAGDHVAVPKYGNINRSSPSIREFVEFTEEKIKPTDESVERLRTRLREEFGTLRDAAASLDLSEDFVYDSLSNRHLALDRLSRILDAIGIELHEIDVERAMLRHGDGIAIPDQFDADLMYLIGLVFGDGDVMVSRRGGNRGHVRISNGDEELLEHAADIFAETFDKSVDIEYHDDRVPCIRLHSAIVARFFSNVGVESPKDDIALDPRLTTAEHADAFLQGLFDADGAVCGRTDGGSSVQFSTVCDELAEQVQLMLETYGVRSRTRERDRRGTSERADGHEIESTSIQTHLAIYGKELDSFADRIGFRSTIKSDNLDEIVRDATRRGEKLPIGNALARADGGAKRYWQNLNREENPSRERTRAMLDELDLGDVEAAVKDVADADLVWDEVVSAEDTGEREVFDLTVPDTHNFIGNGLVTHNTAAAVRDDFGDGQQWTLEAGALVLADKGIAAVDELDKMRCVTGDTLVHTNDGITRIGDIALDAAENGTIESLGNGRTIRDIDLRVWTMTDDNQLVKRDVTAIHEYDAPTELCEVTLESGETVTTTENHPFVVLEDGEHAEKYATELTPDDWIYVPETVPQSSTDGGKASFTGEAATELPLEERSLAPAHGAVLGYLAGDGNVYYNREEGSYGIRFTNTEEELLSDFERSCREAFDGNPVRHPSEQRADGVETVQLHGKAHVDELLNAGSNLETYDGKRVPDGLTTASRETKAAFLRALADAEGTVDERSVKVFSSSYDLLLGAKMLLLEFGVQCQVQTRERDRGRDVYALAITDDESLATFRTQIGFTLDRKRRALADTAERTTGDRTILDVLPDSGTLFAEARESLRLYQSECGLNATTYCNFENGIANASLHRAEQVLSRFEQRRRRAREDLQTLKKPCPWTALEQVKDRYHVTQSELADGTRYTQSQISREWGTADPLHETVRERLIEIVGNVSTVTFEQLAALIRGDVKWRRVSNVNRVPASTADDQLPILRERLADVVGGDTERVVERSRTLLGRELTADSWDQLRSTLKAYEISFQQVADSFDVAGSTVSRWFSGEVDGEDFETVRDRCIELVEAKRANIRELVDTYEQRAARVEQPRVYDLTVEGTHNFLANGMVVHNSEDRSAMHQALEQQRISVNKAGINATLKARCSLLGAANPKYGRFDQYEPIGEQIDLEPALISRFDLIFTVTDEPDPEHDSRLAKHIIKTNYAGELNTQREELASSEFTADQVADVTEEVAPEIDADLLRKYIAHAKRSCYPTMTDEAKDLIEEFYVDLRAKGSGEDDPVPVTARKLEAMVRLAEASARVRLSDTVKREDADRATDIIESCLRDIGVDPETGQFDADVVETGTSKTQRDRIKNIKGLIADVEEEYEEGAPLEEVLDRAGEIGMDPGKAEAEIEKLRTKGEVYEPKQGHLRTT